MREITDHALLEDPAPKLTVSAVDEPGSGGANHLYVVSGMDTKTNPSEGIVGGQIAIPILFQNGTVPEKGLNGVTEAALLAIVIDRLRSFQAGPYRSLGNERCLVLLEVALQSMHDRTRDRLNRGVEGRHAN